MTRAEAVKRVLAPAPLAVAAARAPRARPEPVLLAAQAERRARGAPQEESEAHPPARAAEQGPEAAAELLEWEAEVLGARAAACPRPTPG